jgi:hypothetical protein
MFTRNLTPAIAGLAVLLSSLPAQAQNYTYEAPAPMLTAETNGTERLSADDEAIVYGAWNFNYSLMLDDNLFVTRIFVSDLGVATVGTSIQIDCGRGTFRHTSAPLLYENGSDVGVPMDDVPVYQWMVFDRQKSLGQAMMRTCEEAAREAGTTWTWL